MSQPNEGNNDNALVEFRVKRKRGRPRKFPRQDPDNRDNANGQRGHSSNHGANSSVPPGFDGVNGSHPHQTNTVSNANFPMVGQEVHGAVEGVFDGGFLIGVRVENSATIFRGAVFIPGHYVPVSQENDVAPNLPMIRRNEVSSPLLPSVYNPRSHKRNRAANHYSANQVDSLLQTGLPRIPKSYIVPVVLQPAKISNGVPLTNETSPMETLPARLSTKAMQVLEADYPSNESTPCNRPPTHLQGSHQETSKGNQSESCQPLSEGLHGSEAESMMPFEEVLTEVRERVEAPSHSEENSSNLASNLLVKGSGHYVEDQGDNKVPLRQFEPLQAVWPSQNLSAISTEPSKEGRPGKFDELLKVIQEQTREHELSTKKAPASRPKLNVVRSTENMAKEGFVHDFDINEL
ncbi:hypothetical protein HS088_TW19G00143 [Tripterygium wilfordii]|uniref:AT hook motif-containing protein n=1 Tax=Tripterygium wilfordii TaxID=458696 RepID=A0A7J7C8V4_TRIWF|nr:uncharacterized protein LOC119984975 [Tripterygium wilfordii]XP_038685043.1 uncharacterized protein LOC119984975 [Tripterygium wilfordii]KAF5730552.1 hypothetical protein HS088_TW19G00143 [Tripterygium wilfordii]